MVVTKILEGTLVSGNTTLTFTDSDIPNSLIRVYSTNADVYPASLSVTSNTLTITYEAQSSTLYVAVELVKEGLEVIDDVTTNDGTKALSAKQGLYLKGLIDNLGAPSIGELTDVTISSPSDGDVLVYNNGSWINMGNNITNLNDVDVDDIEDGQVLAWDDNDSKFKNVDMSGDISYSTSEQAIGTWVDGKTIYQKCVDFGSLPNNNTKTVAHDIEYIDTLIDVRFFAYDSARTNFLPFNFCAAVVANNLQDIRYQTSGYVTKDNIRVDTRVDRSGYSGYVILQYTKI